MVKYCPRCGYPNPDDAMYCIRCGYQFPLTQPLNQPTVQQPPVSPPPYPQPPQNPPNQQPPYGAPPAQPPSDQPPKKKFSTKVIIGAAVAAVVVVLVVLVVALPLLTPHGLTAVASTAQSLFGGSWSVDKNKSGTGVYIGNGEYRVTFLNGSTEIISLSQWNINGLTSFSAPSSSGFAYTPPSKIAVAVAQGNVNGRPAYIIVVGEYWNTSPNFASYLYDQTQQLASMGGQDLQQIESEAAAKGETIKIGTSGGYDYALMYTDNPSTIQEVEFQSGIDLDFNYPISQIGIYGQYNSNTLIGVIAINVPMDSVSAGQALAEVVQSSL